MTLTPLMVRVVFLLRRGRSCFTWAVVRKLIMSALDGTSPKLYLPAALIFRRLTSSRVGDGIESKVSIISLSAASLVKWKVPEIRFRLRINKLN